MDNIYDNLEDYEEITHYEQLKSENMELKLKLDQCESALSKLQKEILQDFDNLAAEHQTLQQNFSSLLKTARAEVQRKTDTITHLNAEKDKLFLSLLSDSTNKIKPRGRGMFRRRKRSGSVEICDLRLGSKSLKDVSKETNDKYERKEASTNHHLTRFEIADPDPKVLNTDKCGTSNKENKIRKEANAETKQLLPCSIQNRRKSLPALRHELAKFSTDEEDDDNSTELRKPIASKDKHIRVEEESASSNNIKSSDTSSFNDKFSDTSELRSKRHSLTKPERENVNDKPERQSRYDAHEKNGKEKRSEDKYKLKEKRGRSSYGRLLESRPRSRGSYRDSEDYYYRQENYRYDSPSHDKYHRHKSHDRRSHRSNKRDHSNPEFDRYKYEYHENTSSKKTHRERSSEAEHHNLKRHKDKPDCDPVIEKQLMPKFKKQAKHDECDSDTNVQTCEKQERDFNQSRTDTEKPNSCDKPPKYRIPKKIVETKKNDCLKILQTHEKDYNLDGSHKATSLEKLAETDDHSTNNPVACKNLNLGKDQRHNDQTLWEKQSEHYYHETDSDNLKTHHEYNETEFKIVPRKNRPVTIFDRRMTRPVGKQSPNHMIPDELEEPITKRRRTDSYRRNDEYSEENVIMNVRERSSTELGSRFGYNSCQSPDEIRVDNFIVPERTREIMNTAETGLEDPRLTSNRYVTVNDSSSKIRLAVSSQHVHMYKLSWASDTENKLKHVQNTMGETKHKEYSEQNKHHEHKIKNNAKETEIDPYIDVENNLLHESLESGEIEDVYSDLITGTSPNESTEPSTNSETPQNFEQLQKPDITAEVPCPSSKVERPAIMNVPRDVDPPMPLEELFKPSSIDKSPISNRVFVDTTTELLSLEVSRETGIPKSNKSEISLDIPLLKDFSMPPIELFKPSIPEKKAEIQSNDSFSPSSSDIPKEQNISKKSKYEKTSGGPKNKRPRVFETSKPQITNKTVTKISTEVNGLTSKADDNVQKENDSRTIDTPAKRLILQGDLELSDDDVDLLSENIIANSKKGSKTLKKENSDDIKLTSQNTKEKLKIRAKKDPELDENKKCKSITNTHNNKEPEQRPNKTTENKDSTKTKDINLKLSDLFGETSLITLEDLEIPRENYSEYVPSSPEYALMVDNDNCKLLEKSVEKPNKSAKIQTRSSIKPKSDADDKNINKTENKKMRKFSGSSTNKVEETSEKHILPKKRKNDITKGKTSTECAGICSVEVDVIRVINDATDDDVFKTVIISCGSQQQCVPNVTNTVITEPIIVMETPKPTLASKDSMKALATSTPVQEHENHEIESTTARVSENSSTSSAEQITANVSSMQSINNVPETNITIDKPDVRVVLTRRKRKRLSQ